MKSLTHLPGILSAICSFAALFTATDINAAGGNQYKFWVELKDKVGTPYSILRPNEFLSERSMARRKKAGVPVITEDLPVTPAYVQAIRATGVEVLLQSRWMNAVLVSTTDSTLAKTITSLTPVRKVSLMGVWKKKRGAAATNPDAFGEMAVEEDLSTISVKNKRSDIPWNNGYGMGYDQIRQLHGEWLHQRGYRGRGVLVAVMDAGFYRVNRLQAFDSLRQRGGIVATRDLVDADASVYNDDDHGTSVLSCMAANVPGVMVGTAPDADYLLIRTEDAGSEFPVEEATWVVGAELADSMGADVINSSLGYTEFDLPELSHSYNDLDGNTTLISRAANIAWSKGLLVVNSAGNEGDGSWKYIGAPADAAGVIAVGAVDKYGRRAGFSSMGPTADHRVKPDLSAMGSRTVVAAGSGYFIRSNGTSFSSPVLAGMVACAVQYMPGLTPVQIRTLITRSASGFPGSDELTGYGIPDMSQLAVLLNGTPADSSFPVFMGWPTADSITTPIAVKTVRKPAVKWMYTLKGANGKTIASGMFDSWDASLYGIVIEPSKYGKYTLEVTDGKQQWKKEFFFAEPESDGDDE